jgi:predicted metal-dependent peptidase
MTDQLEQRIEEAEQSSPGSVPGCLKDAVGLRLRPQADPFDVLRATVARAIASPVGAPDYTLRKFSRRQQADGPRLRGVKKEMPNVVVILDTSGSMHGDRVEKAMGVIAKAVSRLKSVKVVSFDSRLHDRKMVTSMGQFKWEGGGGTGMGRAIEEVDKADRPDAIVLITDLETDWPQRQPRARVVVAAVDAKDYWLERVPGWVKLCDVSKGGDR